MFQNWTSAVCFSERKFFGKAEGSLDFSLCRVLGARKAELNGEKANEAVGGRRLDRRTELSTGARTVYRIALSNKESFGQTPDLVSVIGRF